MISACGTGTACSEQENHNRINQRQLQGGRITISDRASRGPCADLGGPALKRAAEGYGWCVLQELLVPEEKHEIQQSIRVPVAQCCHLVLTTAGTGVALRDMPPEGVREIAARKLAGAD